MWRITVILILIFVSMMVARAEGPVPMPIQNAVVHVDRMLQEVHKDLFKGDNQKFFDNFMPVNDFRFYVDPKIGKSISKGKLYYTVGFKFTF